MAEWAAVLACWLSGQMDDGDLHARMRGDPLFALWVGWALQRRAQCSGT